MYTNQSLWGGGGGGGSHALKAPGVRTKLFLSYPRTCQPFSLPGFPFYVGSVQKSIEREI